MYGVISSISRNTDAFKFVKTNDGIMPSIKANAKVGTRISCSRDVTSTKATLH